MAEPFKNLLSPNLVDDMGKALARSAKSAGVPFDARRFTREAKSGLEVLELKGRALHVAMALEAALPESFDTIATILEGSLAPPATSDALGSLRSGPDGLAGWAVWPLTLVVEHTGFTHPKRALACLRELTMRFSSEWAIRAFVEHHPELTFKTLARWTRDPNLHVRRLVSEGTRPRLPWGQRLVSLVKDPSPTLPLLEALRDDPEEYVRRSVANHLNDIAKDHPDLVATLLADWMKGATKEREKLVRHASRSLVKAGHTNTLAVHGASEPFQGRASLSLEKAKLRMGDTLAFRVALTSTSKHEQRLVVDYVIHHVKKSGGTSPKVFKGWTFDLAANEARELRKSHKIVPITTRVYYAGTHALECVVNGRPVARADFDLRVAEGEGGGPRRA